MAAEIHHPRNEEIVESPPMRKALYTLHELAELMGMSYAAAWGHYSAGSLPWEPIIVGRKKLFLRTEVDRTLGLSEE